MPTSYLRPARGKPAEPLALTAADAVTDSRGTRQRRGTRSDAAKANRRAARAVRRRDKRRLVRSLRNSSERPRTPSATAASPHSGGSTRPCLCKEVYPSVIRMYTWNVRSLLGYANRLAVIESLKATKGNVPLIALQETRLREAVQGEPLGDHILYSSPALGGIGGVGFLVRSDVKVQSWAPVSNRIAHITLDCGKTIVVCYAPTEVAPQGQKEVFWDALEEVVRLESPDIVCGDFNARLGSDLDRDQIHGFGKAFAYEETNDNGWRLVMLAAVSHLEHAASHFRKPQTHLGTWLSPAEKCWHQLDHFLIRGDRNIRVLDVRVRRTVTGSSDHCALELSVRTKVTYGPTRPFRGWRVAPRSIVDRRTFNAKIREEQAQREFEQDIIRACPRNGAYSDLVGVLQTSMRKLDGARTHPEKPWLSAPHVVAALSDKRSKWKESLCSKTPEAFDLFREARGKVVAAVKKAKADFIEQKCAQIENAEAQHAVGDVKRLINEMKSGLGFTLTRKQHDPLSPWEFADHFKQLFALKECALPPLDPADLLLERKGGDDITLTEVKDSLNSMDNGKAPGANGVLTSALKAGDEHTLRILHQLCQQWWNNPMSIPEALVHSIIVPFYKKGDRKDAGNYRGINLLDHIGKVYAGVLGQRLRPLAESFVGEKQYGFLPAKGTIDAVHVLRRCQEACNRNGGRLSAVFLDLKAAFDKVPRTAIWRALRLAGCDEKLISAVESLHRDTVAQVQTQSGISETFPIEMGTRQGCRIAPLLFIIFMEMVLRDANLEVGLSIPCHSEDSVESANLSCLLFADDIVLLADDDLALQRNLDRLSASLARFGMEISLPKTKCLILSEGLGDSNLRLKVNDSEVEEVDKFVYLGSLFPKGRNLVAPYRHRATVALGKLSSLAVVLKSSKVSLSSKEAIIKRVVLASALYGLETAPYHEESLRRLDVLLNRCRRMSLGLTLRDRVHGEQLWERFPLVDPKHVLAQRRLRWAGRTLSTQVIGGLVEKSCRLKLIKRRGRPPTVWQTSLKADANLFRPCKSLAEAFVVGKELFGAPIPTVPKAPKIFTCSRCVHCGKKYFRACNLAKHMERCGAQPLSSVRGG